MRPYEAMVIFDAGVEAPAIQAVVDRLLDTIRASDGVPGHVDRWGRRPFAYEVKHRREGYYVLVELSGEPRTVAEVHRLLTLADEVLRFKVIRLPDRVAARVASGVPGYGRSAGRGPSPRARGGRGFRADGAEPEGQVSRTAASTRSGEAEGARSAGAPTGEGAPSGAAADAVDAADLVLPAGD